MRIQNICAIYQPLLLRRGWKGKTAVWFAVIGFVYAVFVTEYVISDPLMLLHRQGPGRC